MSISLESNKLYCDNCQNAILKKVVRLSIGTSNYYMYYCRECLIKAINFLPKEIEFIEAHPYTECKLRDCDK